MGDVLKTAMGTDIYLTHTRPYHTFMKKATSVSRCQLPRAPPKAIGRPLPASKLTAWSSQTYLTNTSHRDLQSQGVSVQSIWAAH